MDDHVQPFLKDDLSDIDDGESHEVSNTKILLKTNNESEVNKLKKAKPVFHSSLDPTFWAEKDMEEVQKYIDWHHNHPNCFTPRPEKPEDSLRKGMMVDNTWGKPMVYFHIPSDVMPPPPEFQVNRFGADCDTESVARVAVEYNKKNSYHLHGHEDYDYFNRNNVNPWLAQSVQDELIKYHSADNVSISKILRPTIRDIYIGEVQDFNDSFSIDKSLTMDSMSAITSYTSSSSITTKTRESSALSTVPFPGYLGGSPWVQLDSTSSLNSLSAQDTFVSKKSNAKSEIDLMTSQSSSSLSNALQPQSVNSLKNKQAHTSQVNTKNRFLSNGQALKTYNEHVRTQRILEAYRLFEQEEQLGLVQKPILVNEKSYSSFKFSDKSVTDFKKSIKENISANRKNQTNSILNSLNVFKKSLFGNNHAKVHASSSDDKQHNKLTVNTETNNSKAKTFATDNNNVAEGGDMLIANHINEKQTNEDENIEDQNVEAMNYRKNKLILGSTKYHIYKPSTLRDMANQLGGVNALNKIASSFISYSKHIQNRSILQAQNKEIALTMNVNGTEKGSQEQAVALFDACDRLQVTKVKAYLLTHGLLSDTLFEGDVPPLYYMFTKALSMDLASSSFGEDSIEDILTKNKSDAKDKQSIHESPDRTKVSQIMQVLLDYRSPIDKITQTTGLAVIHLAVIQGNNKMIRWCVDRGSSIHLRSGAIHNNATPMQLAAKYGNILSMIFIYSLGGLFDETDSLGNSLLHIAASTGSSATTLFLLRIGIKKSTANNKGMFPSDVAIEQKNPSLAQIILEFNLPPIPKMEILNFQYANSNQNPRTNTQQQPHSDVQHSKLPFIPQRKAKGKIDADKNSKVTSIGVTIDAHKKKITNLVNNAKDGLKDSLIQGFDYVRDTLDV